jgi:hypothetical protein
MVQQIIEQRAHSVGSHLVTPWRCSDQACWCWAQELAQRRASETYPRPRLPPLSMWVIYDHPKDEPASFIARRWVIMEGEMRPTLETISCQTVQAIRDFLTGSMALTRFPRSPGDDPCILEVWL